MDTITITKPQLEAVYRRWVQDVRAGKCRTQEECDAMPDEQLAEESTNYLWTQLSEPVSA